MNAEIEKMEKSIANAKRKIESCEKKRKKLLQEVYNNKYLRLSELQICYVREIYRLDLDGYDVIDFKGVYAGFRYGIFEYENWGLHEDGYFTEDEFTLPEEYMDTTTCLIVNGQNDSMVRDEPERYHNALASNGVNHYYYTIPGDHNMDVWANGLYHFLKVAFK